MDALEVLVAVGVLLASLPFGGPLAVLAVMALLDVPSGFQETATDFISDGGWAVLALGGLIALGVGLYAVRRHREPAAAGMPQGNGAAHD